MHPGYLISKSISRLTFDFLISINLSPRSTLTFLLILIILIGALEVLIPDFNKISVHSLADPSSIGTS